MSTKLSRVLVLVLLTVLFAACGSNAADTGSDVDSPVSADPTTADDTPATSAPTSDDAAVTAAPAEPATSTSVPTEFVPSGAELAPLGRLTSWDVVIGDGIEASLLLSQNGTYIHGELTYATSSTPITVVGQAYDAGDGYFLREFGDDGRVSGTLILGNVNNGVITDAEWGDLSATVTFNERFDAPYLFDPLIRTGAYRYFYAPFIEDEPNGAASDPPTCCGPIGEMTISAVTSDTITVSFQNNRGAPSYSIAYINTITLPLTDNVALYEDRTEFTDCAFDITVFDGFAYVDYVDDRFACGFGNGASVVGQYLLTDPFADSPFGEATLTTTSYGDIELGMTWAELVDATAIAPYDPLVHDRVGEDCNYTSDSTDPLAPWLMMLGVGDAAVVSRIEIPPGATTGSGLGVGSTEAEVRAVYGDAIAETPHQYLNAGAKYLTVERATDGPIDTSSILFETDENGVVLAVRNGLLGPLPWVEGCL